MGSSELACGTGEAATILVVDDMAIFRDPIAASLRLAKYQTLCALDGEEAMRLTRAHHPSLILLDVAMPKMDGLTFRKHIRADPTIAGTPVILLTAISEKQYVVAAAALRVKEYLLKSRFRLKDLFDRIERQLGTAPTAPQATKNSSTARPAASESHRPPVDNGQQPPATVSGGAPAANGAAGAVRQLMTREECVRRAEGVLQAKTLSGVITQVITVANSPRGDTAQLAALIARDPMMSARVLQAANSAAYASNVAVVTTIPDAIRKVGCTTVRNIAAALGVFDMMPETGADGFNPIRCWQHSFAVAQICERLAAQMKPEHAGLAYVVGLCHDLAEILIHSHFGSEYRLVLDACAATGEPKDKVEREMLGMTRAELSRTIFRCIALPDSIREPVEILHGPAAERTSNPLARALWMAEHYANGAMLASGPTSLISPVSQAMAKAVTGETDPARPDPATLRAEVGCLTTMLARLSRGDEAKLNAPLFNASPARVWLARDPSFSSFDPVETCLRSLADVQVHDRLPLATEAATLDGLIVLARSALVPGLTQDDVRNVLARCTRAGRVLPLLWSVATQAPAADNGGSGQLAIRPGTAFELRELAAFVESLPRADSGAADAA